jgi:hypothetical protein
MQGLWTPQTTAPELASGERMERMARAKHAERRASDPLAAYRWIRTPRPRPQQVVRDRRPDLTREQARREIEDAR